MEFRSYLAILARRGWLIVATMLAATLAALVGIWMLPPVYEASATLRVAISDDPLERASYDSVMYAGRLTNTYSKIATSGSVLDEVAARLGLGAPPKIKVDVPANTELMQIAAEHGDPVMAAQVANALADVLIGRARQLSIESAKQAREAVGDRLTQAEAELEQAGGTAAPGQAAPSAAAPSAAAPSAAAQGTLAGGDRAEAAAGRSIDLKRERYARLLDQHDRLRAAEATRANTMTVVEPASVPLAPSRPRRSLYLAVALMLGLVGGTGVAFLFENLDTTLHTTRRIAEVADLRVLGAVPTAATRGPSGLFASGSPEHEALGRLRTHLLALEGGAPRTLLVTSAEPAEGKSTVVANLAATLADAGRRVVVVDADLRLPTLHTIFGVPNQLGLSSILDDKATWDRVIRESGVPNVWVIAAGPPTPRPAELLGTPGAALLIADLGRWFDVVLVDAPSLLAVADAAVLASVVDGVALVVGRGRAREDAVRAARSELADVQARSIGVIVNRAEPVGAYRYYQRSATLRVAMHGRHRGDAREQHAAS